MLSSPQHIFPIILIQFKTKSLSRDFLFNTSNICVIISHSIILPIIFFSSLDNCERISKTKDSVSRLPVEFVSNRRANMITKSIY